MTKLSEAQSRDERASEKEEKGLKKCDGNRRERSSHVQVNHVSLSLSLPRLSVTSLRQLSRLFSSRTRTLSE